MLIVTIRNTTYYIQYKKYYTSDSYLKFFYRIMFKDPKVTIEKLFLRLLAMGRCLKHTVSIEAYKSNYTTPITDYITIF